ncbi:MAG: hypothetical protein C0594_09065 [Marinilabiliales bacterium]|nr:MAG: hypothetical protein C0594_09065 [Marinilabiliales bacterium]
MAEFKSFDKNVEVNGPTVLSVINAMKGFEAIDDEILKENGIENPAEDTWHNQQAWLSAFEKIGEKLGSNTLFLIGKAIPENAQFPPEIDNLEKGLASIDMAYQMNHRGGDIGYYKLVSFDGKNRKAVMECKNPYPSDFDKGIITSIVRKFGPDDAAEEVVLDDSKPTRKNGADSCTYQIEW